MSKPRVITDSDRLPHTLYRAAEIRTLEQAAIEAEGITSAELMERAGRCAYRLLRDIWPTARTLTVLCGGGNNGGDGYVVARLGIQEGLAVRVLALSPPARPSGDAATMANALVRAGGRIEPFQGLPAATDLIVDALLGTGLARAVAGPWAEVIRQVNAHAAPVLAIDIPTGLDGDTGAILGEAIRATTTISFLGLKPGLFTGAGPDCCGRIHFSTLQIPATAYSRVRATARRIDWPMLAEGLPQRPRTAHKGDLGHALIIGGAPGMPGAVRLAGEAALRAGAGLVTIATHPSHAACLNLTRPELLCYGVADAADLASLIERADVVAIGPGLDQTAWAQALWTAALGAKRPLVVDADALNLLARVPHRCDAWVLTPHPGEAARLLGTTTAEVQRDRLAAAAALQQRYGGRVVLKGAGTLIQGPTHGPPAVCSGGNPGMASGGTGDVLTGIIAALIGQGLDLDEAVCTGVCLHAAAGDLAASDGERGLLAGDLIAALRSTLSRRGEP